MKVLVLGATGQLGQDLLRVLGTQAAGLSHQDLDITDGVGVAAALNSQRPDWVVNSTAFHRVDDCELNPSLTFAVNTLGALNVARAAAQVGSGVAFISTDYVFGGERRPRGHPHDELAMPTPLNVYGVSKWAGEQVVMQANPRHLVIRSAGLYGTATSRKGWTFPELMLNKARSDGLVRVVTDQALSPTYTADLAATIQELMQRQAVGLYHVANAGECSWFEFARATFELARIDVKMEPITTTQSGRRAVRPSYSALSSIRLGEAGVAPLRPWRQALQDYLEKKGVLKTGTAEPK